MNGEDVARLARELLDAAEEGICIDPPSRRIRGFDMAAGYAVARRILAMRQGRGDALVGRKIGFTNRNIWAEYGVDSPIWAPVYAATLHRARTRPATHCLGATVAPRIEPEIALGLRSGVNATPTDAASVLECVAWIAPAFEIVDCHYPDWHFSVADAIADQSFHSALILGTPVPLDRMPRDDWVERLATAEVRLARDGTEMDRGVGANALGHPALALAFLARTLERFPGFPPLGPGEIVSTGTLTAALPVTRGETWSMRFEGLPLEPLALRFV